MKWVATPAAFPFVFLAGVLVGPYCEQYLPKLRSLQWATQSNPPGLRRMQQVVMTDAPAGIAKPSAKGKANVNGSLHIEFYSEVAGGNLMPGFLFMQGESDGLEQSISLNIGGGHGKAIPFVPDDSCDDKIFDGASPDLRSPQLPYLKLDTWTCERSPKTVPAVILETPELRATITPQFGGKVWGMYDKINKKEFFFNNNAHQPANIGARAAWTAGGLEFNWSPGYLGHSAFTEDQVWAAKLETSRGDVIRVWEYDRYNGTVFQVDMLLDGGELWTHSKVTNPTSNDLIGYWWTCAAHRASPESRILAPAETVTVETYVGAPLRNAPWPAFNNGMLNSTFGGKDGERLVDSSYLGNIAYTGDYFLRIEPEKRKWIAHQDEDGYMAVHGHPMNGTKFFTWGQSGPGRFMQDFLAGGDVGGGYYTELQSGRKPTQQQVFDFPAQSSFAFTEYYKPFVHTAAKKQSYKDAVDAIGDWWSSEQGIPTKKVSEMEDFFKELEDREVKQSEIISTGSAWGGLHEKLTGTKLSKGTLFPVPEQAETKLWQELAETGSFSEATLASRAPLSYAVDNTWVAAVEASAKKSRTWLHDLLLGIAYAEAGEVERPQWLFQRSLMSGKVQSPIAARCLAVLSSDPEQAWAYLSSAWSLALEAGPRGETQDVTQRLRRSVIGEMLLFTMGNLGPDAFQGHVDKSGPWLARLRSTVAAAQAAPLVGQSGSDLIIMSRVLLSVVDKDFSVAKALLKTECFPTFGRSRDTLASLWKAAVEGEAALNAGKLLSPAEAREARKRSPVPRNLGCPYATLYCEDYW